MDHHTQNIAQAAPSAGVIDPAAQDIIDQNAPHAHGHHGHGHTHEHGHDPNHHAIHSTAPLATTGGLGNERKHTAAPPSQVADVEYPNVPETTEPQQAATAPGAGGVVDGGPTTSKVPFKEQVNGYAKKIAGTVFRNEDEKEFGEKKLEGEA